MTERFKSAYVLMVVLLAAFSTLAVLQYRWIGAVSTAERQRMQTSLELATSRFAEEFNAEIARILISLVRVQNPSFPPGSAELFFQWAATSKYPHMVRNVLLVENGSPDGLRVLRLDPNTKVFEPCDWPGYLLDVKDRLFRNFPEDPSAPARRGLPFLSREPPTVLAPLARLVRGPFAAISSFPPQPVIPDEPPDWVVVEFDQDFIVKNVFPALVERYFYALGEGEFRVQVLTRGEPRKIVYRSDSSAASHGLRTADSTADLFEFRPGPFAPMTPQRSGSGARSRRDVFTLLLPERDGHWQVLVEHRLGSLDAAASQLRRRNLAVSFGILLVLVAGVVLLIIASERERMLARLQMQFAAAVSHELRTPLAAIQALTHNLSSGIIKDPSHVREYALMVHHETRGLSSIVDQILLFAEARAIRRKYETGSVDVVEVMDHALSYLTAQIRTSGCEILIDIPDDLPPVRANAVSLAHCVRNLVSNALKYGIETTPRIEITATAAAPEVRLCVTDYGPGISTADWPRLFEPFFRGHTAKPGKRGAGLGLYLVKRMIEAQGGRITVETRLHRGSTFTLHVPVFDQEPRHGAPAVSG